MTETRGVLDEPVGAWRAIVLYGQNTAIYKIALGQCLAGFAAEGRDRISLPELAAAFFDRYAERLRSGQPQLLTPGRLTVMERVVALYRQATLSRDQAVERVGQEAFGDVVPRFHTVADRSVPVRFYERSPDGGLVLTDAAYSGFTCPNTTLTGGPLAVGTSQLKTTGCRL